ncbi:hypothetical protein [Micropruina glycogenica]|uniref:Uncharacterized protein n=1 Tax=Micropruina glycogenica TaxID=75385 RepID=A0A2N9JBX9_9ACTN|nr:hypothetical protein [Micropruina glycogenica]SPD85253.1 protein of unknown function [Micropruina glycogenica]
MDKIVQLKCVDRSKVARAIDEQAKKFLNLSGVEFLARLQRGEYEGVDNPAVSRLSHAAQLLN